MAPAQCFMIYFVVIARLLRERYLAPNRWIAGRLNMGAGLHRSELGESPQNWQSST